MKIIAISDVHIETGNRILDVIPTETPDVFVLAGDIHQGTDARVFISCLLELAPVIYIAGNHEFYNHNFPETYTNIAEMCRELNACDEVPHKVFFLQNQSVFLSGIRFIGTTLWTNYDGNSPQTKLIAQNRMSDFRLILTDEYKCVTPDMFYDEFLKSRAFLEDTLKSSNPEKTVVVTHHSPSFLGVSPDFAGNIMNGAFHSDLSSLIEECGPKLWIHGHVHQAVDYYIGTTRVYSNCYGYPHEGYLRQFGYDRNKILEI